MARIRSIHPEFCTDETLSLLSAEAERTFVRLWPHLDDDGRALDHPRLLKAALYPLHDDVTADDVDRHLSELAGHALIWRYEVDGKRYLTAKPDAWKRWQRPRHPSPSKFPAPPDDYSVPPEAYREAPEDDGKAPAGVVVGEGVGDGEGEPPLPPRDEAAGLALVLHTASPPATDPVSAVFDAWRDSTGKQRAVLDDKRRRVITKALRHYPVGDLVAAVDGWRHSPHHRGENDRRTVYNDLDVLLRDSKQVEFFRDLTYGVAPRPDDQRVRSKNHDAIARFAQREGA